MDAWSQKKLILQLMGEIGLAHYEPNEKGEYRKPKSFINVGSSKGLLILAYVYLRQIAEPDDYLRRSEVAKLFWEGFEQKAQNNNLRGVINKVNKVFVAEYGSPIFEKGVNRQVNSFLRLVDNFEDYLVLDILLLEKAIIENKSDIVALFANKKFCLSCPMDIDNESLGFWIDDQRIKYRQLLKQYSPESEKDNDYLDPKVSASNILRKMDLDNPGEEIIEFYLTRKHDTVYPQELSFRKERDLEAILNYCKEHFRGLQDQLQSFQQTKHGNGKNKRLMADDMFEIFLAVAVLGEKAPIAQSSPVLNSFFYQALDNYYEVDKNHRELYHSILQELKYDAWLISDDESPYMAVASQEFAQDLIKKNSLVAVELAKILLEQYQEIYPNAEQYQESLASIINNIPFSELEPEFYPIYAKHIELLCKGYKEADYYGKIVDELAAFFDKMRAARYELKTLSNYSDLIWFYLLALERLSEYSTMSTVFKEFSGVEDDSQIFDYLLKNSDNLKILALFLKYSYRLGKIAELERYLKITEQYSEVLENDSWAEALIHNVRGSLSWEVFGRTNYFKALHHFQKFKKKITELVDLNKSKSEFTEELSSIFNKELVNSDWLELIAETALTKSLGVMDRGSYKEAAEHCEQLSVAWQQLGQKYPPIKDLYAAIGSGDDILLEKAEEKLKKYFIKNKISLDLFELTRESMKAGRYWQISKGFYDDALEWFEMALMSWSDLAERQMLLDNLQNMAAVFGDMRDFEKAQEYFDEALEICEKDPNMKLQQLKVLFNSGYMYQNYIGDYPNYSQSCIDEALSKYRQFDELVGDLLQRGHEIPKEFMVQYYSNKGLLGLDILRKDGHDLSRAAKNENESKARDKVLADFETAFNYAQEIAKEELILRTKIYVLLLKAIESRRLRLLNKKIDEFNKKGYHDAAMMANMSWFFPQDGSS